MFAGGAIATTAAIYALHPGALQATPPPLEGRADEGLPPVIIYTSLPPHMPVRSSPQQVPAPERLTAVEPPSALTLSPAVGLDAGEVFEIQAMLRELSYNPGPIDGVAGPRTVTAVERYEEAHGQARTGRLDRALLERLRRQTERQTANRP